MKLSRNKKRIVVIFWYLVIFTVIGSVIYILLKPAPSCQDGKLNQGEREIDCGGPCAPCFVPIKAQSLVVEEKGFVVGGVDTYDVMAKINNPNTEYSIQSFTYEFTLKDAAGTVLATRKGSTYILPAERKYLVETNVKTQGKPSTMEVTFSIPEWQELYGFEPLNLNIYNKQYTAIDGGINNKAYGLLRNESVFDFNLIRVKVLLRDSAGTLAGLNTTEMRTVNTGEQRDFTLIWPKMFPGDIAKIEVEAEANVFDSENFIKKYSAPKKFQQR